MPASVCGRRAAVREVWLPGVDWVPIERVIENYSKGFADLPLKPGGCGFFESQLLELAGGGRSQELTNMQEVQ